LRHQLERVSARKPYFPRCWAYQYAQHGKFFPVRDAFPQKHKKTRPKKRACLFIAASLNLTRFLTTALVLNVALEIAESL
jgi:hypothetical protein